MYVPAHFKQESIPILHEAIRRSGFGTLVTMGESGLEASHIPMLIDPSAGPFGTLHGHIARANFQWRRATTSVQAVAMFLGPNAYITPSWYPTKYKTGKVVPTWNYVAVHAHGTIAFFDDPSDLRTMVTKLTKVHEAARSTPWEVDDAPAEYIDSMLKGIVGFKLSITRLEGAWKLSQNRPADDVAGVREGLRSESGKARHDIAALMADDEPR
jgi:transcriptional regulator